LVTTFSGTYIPIPVIDELYILYSLVQLQFNQRMEKSIDFKKMKADNSVNPWLSDALGRKFLIGFRTHFCL